MLSLARKAILCLLLPSIAGCGGTCDAILRIYNWPAARVFDSGGEPITDATVTYAAVGDEPRPCEPQDDSFFSVEDDGYYGCGERYPETGLFIVRATRNGVSVTGSVEIAEVGQCGELVGGVIDLVLPDEPTASGPN